MGTYRQTLLYNFSTPVTLLTGETRVHSDDLMISSCSLIFKDVEERTPRGVENALGQMMIFHHIGDLKVLNDNALIALCIRFRDLEMVISALPTDLQVCLGDVLRGFTATVTALLTSAQCALFAYKCSLRGAIETRVLNRVPFAISQEGLQAHVDADIGMLTRAWKMLCLWLCFTDDERVPMPISPQDKMHRFGSSLYWPMQLDLEKVPHLLGDNEVFLVLVEIAVLTVLPELNGVPSVWLLEVREPDSRDVVLFRGKKPFEGLGEAISEHLHRRGWHMFTLPLESFFQVILAWKRPILLILGLDRFKHPIVNDAGLCQASHKQAGLCQASHKQAGLCFIHE